MSLTKRFILIFFVLITCVGCDQTTKSIARSVLPETEAWSYFSDTVRLQLIYNNGGFLGLGSSLPEPLRKGVFTVGVGNLFDRLAYDGSVVDFINIGIGSVRTGIFNVADVAITAGVIILFSTAYRIDKQKER